MGIPPTSSHEFSSRPRRLFPAFLPHCVLFLLLGLPWCSVFPAIASSNWELQEERDGVEFYLRAYPGSRIPEFKAVTRITTSMASILAVLLDVEAYPEWVHRCREAFPLKVVNDREQYVYQANTLPLARDRDLIMLAELFHRHRGREVEIRLRARPDFCRKMPTAACNRIYDGRYLRIEEAEGRYRMEQLDNNTIEVTWQQHLDPGGRLPSWLIRVLLSEIPLKTLRALHDRVKIPRYRDSYLFILDGVLRVESPAGATESDTSGYKQ